METKQTMIRFTAQERAWIQKLMEAWGSRTMADAVRRALHDAVGRLKK